MTVLARRIALPALLWALHFIVVYALISAGCAPRAIIEVEVVRGLVVVATCAAAAVALVWLISSGLERRRAPAGSDAAALASAGWWSALISLLAILANLWPVVLLGSCTG